MMGSLIMAGPSGPASHTRQHRKRKEEGGTKERAPLLNDLPLEYYVGEMVSCMARYILQIGANARATDGNVE